MIVGYIPEQSGVCTKYLQIQKHYFTFFGFHLFTMLVTLACFWACAKYCDQCKRATRFEEILQSIQQNNLTFDFVTSFGHSVLT